MVPATRAPSLPSALHLQLLHLPLLLLVVMAGLRPPAPAAALPIVDPGLFVIMGVKTCRAGAGYCLLGTDCTLDEDFLPDDRGGHCDGLRSAFTPSAHFVCCRYSAESTTAPTTAPTTYAPTTDAPATTTDAVAAQTEQQGLDSEARQDSETTEGRFEATTTERFEWDTTTDSQRLNVLTEKNVDEDVGKMSESNSLKRTRIELDGERKTGSGDSFTVTEVTTDGSTDITEVSSSYDSSDSSTGHGISSTESTEIQERADEKTEEFSDTEEKKNGIYSFTSNGQMMHDILKLITEGEWQISFKNNELGDENDSTEETSTEFIPPSTYSPNDSDVYKESDSEKDDEGNGDQLIPTTTDFSTGTTIFNTEKDPATIESKEDPAYILLKSAENQNENTPPDHLMTSIHKEIIVKDKDGQDSTTTEAFANSTESVAGEKETTVDVNQVTSDASGAQATERPEVNGLCLDDDSSGDGDCWLMRFVDERYDSFICHGAKISRNFILTSAVCAISLYQAGTTNVRAGSFRAPKASMKVISIAVHEEFRPKALDTERYDLGLIEITPDDSCSACLVAENMKLAPSSCYTFAGNQGDGDVERRKCEEVSPEQGEKGNQSVKCSLADGSNFQVHSGAPLACGGALAGVAFSSQGAPAFTPVAQLLPWVRWNLKKLKA